MRGTKANCMARYGMMDIWLRNRQVDGSSWFLGVHVVVNRHYGSCLYASCYAENDPISWTDQQGGGLHIPFHSFPTYFTKYNSRDCLQLKRVLFWKVVKVVFQLFWWLISIYSTIPSRTTSMTAARNPTRRLPTLTLSTYAYLSRQAVARFPAKVH